MAHPTLTKAEHEAIAAAVIAAEATTNGEIVTIVARASDRYHDVALHWAMLAMLLVLALLAWAPGVADPSAPVIALPPRAITTVRGEVMDGP